MAASRQPLFLARDSYRKRRLRDGAWVLPIFGLILVMLPLMWPAVPHMVIGHWAYLFVLWAGLIGLAAFLSRGLRENEAASTQDSPNSLFADSNRASGPTEDKPSGMPRALQNRL